MRRGTVAVPSYEQPPSVGSTYDYGSCGYGNTGSNSKSFHESQPTAARSNLLRRGTVAVSVHDSKTRHNLAESEMPTEERLKNELDVSLKQRAQLQVSVFSRSK